MEIYRDVADWKGKAGKLLEALLEVIKSPNLTVARRIAEKAINDHRDQK